MKKELTPESEKKAIPQTFTRVFVDDLETIDEIGKRESCVNRATAIAWILWRLSTLERLYTMVVGRQLSGTVRARWHIDPITKEKTLIKEDEST